MAGGRTEYLAIHSFGLSWLESFWQSDSIVMTDEKEKSDLLIRIALLEARVELISISLKGVVGVLVAAAVKYFFFNSH